MNRNHRKQIRLPAEAYLEPGSVWHVTIGTQDRTQSQLANQALAERISQLLASRASARNSGLHLYCLMPDHLHLLAEVTHAGLVDVVSELKSNTTRIWWQFGGKGKLWQRSFYDHGIRRREDLEATITYIVDNPVKAGLAEMWEEYSYIGGSLIVGSGPVPDRVRS